MARRCSAPAVRDQIGRDAPHQRFDQLQTALATQLRHQAGQLVQPDALALLRRACRRREVERLGSWVEDDRAHPDGSDPVDERVMHLHDERGAALGRAVHDEDLPQGARAVEPFRHRLAHDAAELGVPTRLGPRHGAHVVGDVELRVVLPHRVHEAARRRLDEPHPVVGDEVDALLDPSDDRGFGDAAAEHEHAADVHVHRSLLGLDRREVRGGEGEWAQRSALRLSARRAGCAGLCRKRGPTRAR